MNGTILSGTLGLLPGLVTLSAELETPTPRHGLLTVGVRPSQYKRSLQDQQWFRRLARDGRVTYSVNRLTVAFKSYRSQLTMPYYNYEYSSYKVATSQSELRCHILLVNLERVMSHFKQHPILFYVL